MRRRRFMAALAAAGFLPALVKSDPLRGWPRKVARRKDLNADVIVVGAGPAGLAIADRLSRRDVRVLVLESGTFRHDPVHQALSDVVPANVKLPFDANFASQRVVGGGTRVWGAYCPRMMASDFTPHFDWRGKQAWPVNFPELERYYCAAERWLRIGIDPKLTRSGNSGCEQVFPSPFAQTAGTGIDFLHERGIARVFAASAGTDRSGTHRPIRLGHEFARRLRARPTVHLLTDATVRRILVDGRGRAEGVSFSGLGGFEGRARAPVTVLCAGAIQNARLLLLSASASSADGLGNMGGHVGRWFMEHPHLRFWLEPGPRAAAHFSRATNLHVYHWYESLKRGGHGSMLLRLATFAERPSWAHTEMPPAGTILLDCLCEQLARSQNAVALADGATDAFGDPLPSLAYGLGAEDDDTLEAAKRAVEPLLNYIGGEVTAEPLGFGSHLMGTTRMSDEPDQGVVDRNLRVHGVPHLYVAGSSVFPTSGAANPTLTLAALSLRLADHLLTQGSEPRGASVTAAAGGGIANIKSNPRAKGR